MVDFLVLTLSLTIAVTFSMVILTGATFMLMLSPRVTKWIMKWYMKMLEKSFDIDYNDKKVG